MAHLNENAVKHITEICDRHAGEKTPLIMILNDIQNEYGYIPLEVQQIVSDKTGISVAEIYGVVTFYSFFSLVPNGKYVIGVCLGTACYVKGAQQVIDKILRNSRYRRRTDDGRRSVHHRRSSLHRSLRYRARRYDQRKSLSQSVRRYGSRHNRGIPRGGSVIGINQN